MPFEMSLLRQAMRGMAEGAACIKAAKLKTASRSHQDMGQPGAWVHMPKIKLKDLACRVSASA